MRQIQCGARGRLLIVLLGGVILCGCNPTPDVPAPEPPKVTVTLPVVRDVPTYLDFTGEIDAVDTVEIRARVQGVLEKINYSESLIGNEKGMMVQEGDLLFVIERDSYEASLEEAQAALAASEAQLVDAQANFERGEQTKKIDPGALTEVQYSALLYNRDKASAAVSSAKASVRDAQIDLGYTEIHAPVSGRISRSLVDAGNLVGAGEQTLLATIVTVDPVNVYFDVNERVLQQSKKRLEEATRESGKEGGKRGRPLPTVLVGQDDDDGAYPHKGELDYVDNQIKSSTRTGEVRARIPNPDGLMIPGSFARVRVEGDTLKDALLVQEQAIQTDLNGKYVFVVDPQPDPLTQAKNVVVKKYITPGQLTGGGMRVVLVEKSSSEKQDDFSETPEEKERRKSQLTKTDQYIVMGFQRARPGMPVTPVEIGSSPEASAEPSAEEATKQPKKDSDEKRDAAKE